MKSAVRRLVLAPLPDGADPDLPDVLAQLAFTVQGVLGRVAAAHAVSVGQARLLAVVQDGRQTITEVAARLQLDKTSVTGLVDRAERRGLVVRVPSERDRRSVQVEITAAGQEVMDRATAAFADEIATLVSGLSAKQRKRLTATASLLVAADARRRGGDTGP